MKKEERRHEQGGKRKRQKEIEKKAGECKAGVLSCGGGTEDTHKTHTHESTHTPNPPAHTQTHTKLIKEGV